MSSPVGHDTWQLPPLQTVPPVHVMPALPVPLPLGLGPHPRVAPQLVGLLFGSTHVALQLTSPD